MKAWLLIALLLASTRVDAQTASWYGADFHGRRTANGERYDMNARTCAHRTFAFGTKVKVTNRRNGLSTICRVNDRGPAAWTGRAIDLSRQGAADLGMIISGVVPVLIQVLGR